MACVFRFTVAAFLPSLTGLSFKGLLRLTVDNYSTEPTYCKGEIYARKAAGKPRKVIKNAAKTLFSIVMVAHPDLFTHQKSKKLMENPAIGLTDGIDCIIIVYKVHTMYTWYIGASGVAMAHAGHR